MFILFFCFFPSVFVLLGSSRCRLALNFPPVFIVSQQCLQPVELSSVTPFFRRCFSSHKTTADLCRHFSIILGTCCRRWYYLKGSGVWKRRDEVVLPPRHRRTRALLPSRCGSPPTISDARTISDAGSCVVSSGRRRADMPDMT